MALVIIALLVAGLTIWAFHERGRMETEPFCVDRDARVTALADPFMLPMLFVFLALFALLLPRTEKTAIYYAGLFASLILYIGIYYFLLLCLLPLLRRVISPRACATLWLLPTFLYMIANFRNLDSTSPLFVVTLPLRWLGTIGVVWAAGFLFLLFWQIISHLRFRRYLLRDAIPAEQSSILSQWEAEQKRRSVKREIPLLVSDKTHTPLTIGCYPRTYRLVLPHLNYTKKEFELIFQHEMRHIQRLDTRTKALLGFCTALCWFNPFMWIARRKVSDDLELSCDELVLTGTDSTTRRQYANLLLDTAGNSRGYTTCLSAAASSMRYRLKHIMSPRKRFPGSVVVAAALFLLILGSSSFALADSPDTVQSQIFEQAPSDTSIDRLYISEESDYDSQRIYGYDEAALTEYLSSLTVRQVYSGNFSEPFGRELDVIYTTEENGETTSSTTIELYDSLIFAYIPYDDMGRLTYMVKEDINWDYIQSLLDFDAPNPDPAPQPPQMMMDFRGGNYQDEKLMHAERTVVSAEQSGEIMETRITADGVGGVFGYPVTQVQLSFSYAPIQNEYQIRVENWDRTETYTVHSSDLTDNILELAPYSAHYTVMGRFYTVRDTTYEMEFYFDVELP